MDELKSKIVAHLQTNGGRVPYQNMIDSLDFQEQRMYPNAIRALKREGTAMQQNRVTEEGGVAFEVFLIQGGGS